MFVDETGDHNLSSVDDAFPLFCLCGCIFAKRYYHEHARPQIDAFKMRWWGRTDVILHSRDIRRQEGPFGFLVGVQKRQAFYGELNNLIRGLQFSVIAVGILKREHIQQYGNRARHPYNLALAFLMERFEKGMRREGTAVEGHILAESRGTREDDRLKAEFDRLKRYGSYYQKFHRITTMWTERKDKNISGLQVADLVAYPVARKILDPTQPQPAYDVVRDKVRHQPGHTWEVLGYGIKIFPQPRFEHGLYLNRRVEENKKGA